MCPHTAIEYTVYICVLILLYMQRGGRVAPFEVLLDMSPHSVFIYACMLLYMCPRTAIHMCPQVARCAWQDKNKNRLTYADVWRRILTYADVCGRTIHMCPQVPRCALARLLKDKMRIRAVYTRLRRL
jgi:hypothetical protein